MAAVFFTPMAFHGFDGHDSKSGPYQMVPVKEARLVGIRTPHQDCFVRSLHDQIVSVACQERISLWGDEHYQFPLVGHSVGRTQVVVESRRGHALAHLTVSVKERRVRTYSILLLQDRQHSTVRSIPDAQRMMGAVGKLYLQQANVQLAPKFAPRTLTVSDDLGIPLDVTKERRDRILHFLPTDELLLIANNVRVIFSWRLAGRQLGVTNEPTALVFLADGSSVYVLAHEVGHALGLSHNDVPDSLMSAEETENPTSPQLFWHEIDKVNPSGT
ncbi:matrixin family metalloprotease [Roseisolibacter agri]|uniref:Peptidase M10 metallopeptidase domain-containing protein n=1 Tax=Roseisolibacter agri TaxID=2014610 RepID=A0AA37VEP4_9BACT|nr:matrixin family metalloprotease [Roseisolibacter agri]GLC25529.1 hypothetical protein rosag_20420 [Roseisolibacter agri]